MKRAWKVYAAVIKDRVDVLCSSSATCIGANTALDTSVLEGSYGDMTDFMSVEDLRMFPPPMPQTTRRSSPRFAMPSFRPADYAMSFFEGRASFEDLFWITGVTHPQYVMLGPSLLPGSGLGCFAIRVIAADTFVCEYTGPRFATLLLAEAVFPSSQHIFAGSTLLEAPMAPNGCACFVVRNYVNDPLIQHLVNAEIRYNIVRGRFEIWSTGSGIGFLEVVLHRLLRGFLE
jgi:hypothetical protein